MLVGASLLALLVAIAVVAVAASPDCSTVGLTAAVTNIDSQVDWQPRFAGSAGQGQVVFVVSRRRTLYMSSDDGVSWLPISKDPKVMPTLAPGDNITIASVFFSADAANAFYAQGESQGVACLWMSNDAGKSWKVRRNEEGIVWMQTHPKLVNVAIGLVFGKDGGRQTWLTTTFGNDWARISGNTTFQTTFGCEDATCEKRTALVYQRSIGEWNDCGEGRCKLEMVNFDPSKTSKAAIGVPTVLQDESDGLLEVQWPWYEQEAKRVLFSSSHVTPAGDTTGEGVVEQRIYFSDTGGLNWTMALFPFGYTRHHMRFVTTESDVMLAGVRDALSTADYGSLYMSANGQEKGRFVLSLRHILFSQPNWHESSTFAGALQLERSAELDGVFLANRYRGIDGFVDTRCAQTVITFDYGATWNMIPQPKSYPPCPAGQECFLHLRLSVEDFPTAYSPTDAVGVWLAQGNVGECLSQKAESTFFSRDGGASWVVMSSERVIFEVSNHGALVTGALTERLTNELVYTIDNGISFDTCTFRALNMSVNNILTRSFNARNFVLEGIDPANGGIGVLVHFDFTDTQNRDCTASDYENWTPAQCLLGRHIVWQRRKPSSKCHNPVEFEVKQDETPCACTAADYECDFCYETDYLTGACVVAPTQACRALTATPEAVCNDPMHVGDTYIVSDGYRLEPNNGCKGGVQHGVEKQCPRSSSTSRNGDGTKVAIAVVVAGLVVAAVLGAGVYIFLKRRKQAQSYGVLQTDDTSLMLDE